MPFDPDHTYEKRIEKEKDEMWEKLKYVRQPRDDMNDKIMESLRRISIRCAKMNESCKNMDDSLDRLDKAISKVSKTLEKMDDEKK